MAKTPRLLFSPSDDEVEVETLELPETEESISTSHSSLNVRTFRSEIGSAFQGSTTETLDFLDLEDDFANDQEEHTLETEPESDNAQDYNLEIPASPEHHSLSYDKAESVFSFPAGDIESNIEVESALHRNTSEFSPLTRCVVVRERSFMHRVSGREFFFFFLETEADPERREEDDHDKSRLCKKFDLDTASQNDISLRSRLTKFELLLIAKRDRRKDRLRIYDVSKEYCPKSKALIDVARENVANVELAASGSFFIYDCFGQALAVQFERTALVKRLGEGMTPRSIMVSLYKSPHTLQTVSANQDQHSSSSEGNSAQSPGSLYATEEPDYDKDVSGVAFVNIDTNNSKIQCAQRMQKTRKVARRLSNQLRKHAKHLLDRKEDIQFSSNKVTMLVNRSPTYHQGQYRLNFHGRVKHASSKNFQLVERTGPTSNGSSLQETLFMQFGKISSNRFTLDFQQPLTSISAFGIALTQFI